MTRIAIVKREKCNPNSCGQHLCIKLCPPNRNEEECIVIGKDNKPYINEELCVGCGICSKRCPTKAIDIINLPEQLKTEPIHQFGKNMFSLYSLPVPIFGKVTGIIGVNGIGKSTSIKILGGLLQPNLGDWNKKDLNYKELINYFKGTESQIFFEKIKNGEIKISYKPQHVDLIPKNFKGKVSAERASSSV